MGSVAQHAPTRAAGSLKVGGRMGRRMRCGVCSMAEGSAGRPVPQRVSDSFLLSLSLIPQRPWRFAPWAWGACASIVLWSRVPRQPPRASSQPYKLDVARRGLLKFCKPTPLTCPHPDVRGQPSVCQACLTPSVCSTCAAQYCLTAGVCVRQ